LVGNLTGLLVMLKGLPLSYNRDLQEDKEPLFDSVRQVLLVLAALKGAYGSLVFNTDTAAAAADDELLVAIDIAEVLVGEGMPFRQAHEVAGSFVGQAVRESRSLRDVVAASENGERFLFLFEPGAALARRQSPGASGPITNSEQRERLTAVVNNLRGVVATQAQ